MEYITLPGSELKVSPICLGTWQFNNGQQSSDKTWEAQPEQVSKQIVDKALELGVNFFDTAEGYLNSEEVLGRVLEGRRKSVVLASKFGHKYSKYTPENIETSLTTSLQSLKTDYLDIYQVHWHTFMGDTAAVVAELKRQQARGRIRHYAVCNFGPQNLKDFLAAGGEPISNQVPYNLLWRALEYEVLPLCRERNIGVLAYSPLQQGLLSGKYRQLEDVPEGRRRTRLFNTKSTTLARHGGEGAEKQMFQALADIRSVCESAGISMPSAALSWCLQNEAVSAVIVGATSPQQVERNVNTVQLQQSVYQQLSAATEELKALFGNNADLWAAESRMA